MGIPGNPTRGRTAVVGRIPFAGERTSATIVVRLIEILFKFISEEFNFSVCVFDGKQRFSNEISIN